VGGLVVRLRQILQWFFAPRLGSLAQRDKPGSGKKRSDVLPSLNAVELGVCTARNFAVGAILISMVLTLLGKNGF
jgi:hypothetical protein